MNSDWIQVNAYVAGRHYPLRVPKEEEERVNKAIELVGEKVKQFQDLYEGKDKQDYLAMILLNFAVEHINNETKRDKEISILNQQLNHIEDLLPNELD